MAEYTARWDELEDEIKTTEERETGLKNEVEILPILTRYTIFTDSMKKYMEWRDKALNSALPILKNESTSITASAQKDKWDNHFAKIGQEAHKMILGFAPKDDDKTPLLQLFTEGLATLESGFFANLKSAPLAWFQGQVQEYTYQFYREMNSLEDKWEEIGYRDKSQVDSLIKDTTEQILAVFKDVVEYLAKQERHGENLLLRAAESAKSAPGMPELAAPSALIEDMLRKAESYRASLDELVNDYMNAYRSQETIVILFGQTREKVRVFLQKTNMDSATDEFEEACKNSLDIAGQSYTKGQKEDAKRFIEKSIPLVKDLFADFKKQYEEFIGDNREIFVGPVGDKTIEEILEKREMDSSWQEISRFNIQKRLKEINAETAKEWHVNIDGLTEEDKKVFEDFWKIELERLGRGLTKVADGPAIDRIKKFYADYWEGLKAKMKSSLGGLQ